MPAIAVLSDMDYPTITAPNQVKNHVVAEFKTIHGSRSVPINNYIGIPNELSELLLVMFVLQM